MAATHRFNHEDYGVRARKKAVRSNRVLEVFAVMATVSALFVGSIATGETRDTELDENQVREAIDIAKSVRGQVQFWRSEEVGVVFGYDERWQPANPAEAATIVVINRKSKASGSLMATCYLQVFEGGIGNLSPDEVRTNASAIAESALKNGQRRDPRMRLLEYRAAVQDNHPVVYFERDSTVVNLNVTNEMQLYAVATAWQGRELLFECGSTVPRKYPSLAGVVENPIQRVLGSLMFQRTQ